MKTIRLSILTSAIILAVSTLAYSQEYSVSPYSIFGIGDVYMTDGGRIAAMGGAGMALRGGRILNTTNPAAISALDSTTFIFDASASGKGSTFRSGGITQSNFNANFTKLAMGWRLTPQWVIGAFVQPYSTVSYKIKDSEMLGSGATVNTTYVGKGGITRFSITNAFNITKSFSAGFNTTFLFGGTETTTTQTYSINENSRTSKVTFDFGLQYHKPVGAYELGFALTGSYRNVLNFNNSREIYNDDYALVKEELKYTTQILLPESYGAGISFSKGPRLMLDLDYKFQRWSLAEDPVFRMKFKDTHRVMGGAAFIPNEQHATSYFGIIQYQAGFSVGNSYLNLNSHNPIEYEFFLGGAFPLRGGSLLNASISYGKKGTTDYGLIREDYVRATFTFSILEHWFLKRLYD